MISVDSDVILAKRAAQGDQRAFKVLVDRYGVSVAQAARSFGIPETDIDDVVQETFVAVWKALGDYDENRPFRAWLFGIAMNKMRDLFRFRKVRSFLFGALDLLSPDTPEQADPAPGPERETAARRELAKVTQTLSMLQREQREVIVLTGIVGLTQPEAAAALGITLKALEGRLTRARGKLSLLIARDSSV
ncbi:RNA polymerase sigma factor [Comamonas thiooxydans]|uniref:RNA polymerase sigma factor n=1 Tax=Comamonas thiooxydans TaxID=363952 RepID=UPI000B3617F3|nr:RNA polymerase sigma factor [Comamonas thiooxydans]BDR09401.1 RNA polymerase sigma factor [Comamonas thiooxydans]